MTNKTKIIIGILVVAAIIFAIVGVTGSLKRNDKNEKKDELDEFYNYFEQDNEKGENEVEDNEEKNQIENDTESSTNSNTQSTVIGREEQESKQEAANIVDYEQKAIEMAKKEWGISVDSYDFRAKKESNTVYIVTVEEQNGNKYRLATYTVDVAAGTVVEK